MEQNLWKTYYFITQISPDLLQMVSIEIISDKICLSQPVRLLSPQEKVQTVEKDKVLK